MSIVKLFANTPYIKNNLINEDLSPNFEPHHELTPKKCFSKINLNNFILVNLQLNSNTKCKHFFKKI